MKLKIVNFLTVALFISLITHTVTYTIISTPIIAKINNPTSQDLRIFGQSGQIATLSAGETKQIDMTPYLVKSIITQIQHTNLKATPDNPVYETYFVVKSHDNIATFNIVDIEKSNNEVFIEETRQGIKTPSKKSYNSQIAEIILHISPQEKASIQLVSHEDIEKAKQQKLQGERKQLESQRILNRPSDITLQKLLPLQRK